MASLIDDSLYTRISLTPIRVEEIGKPTWITTIIEVERNEQLLLSSTFSITNGDYTDLKKGFMAVYEGSIKEYEITTMDGNFQMRVSPSQKPQHLFISIWIGEPYDLMKGFKIIINKSILQKFVNDLEKDEKLILPHGSLPGK